MAAFGPPPGQPAPPSKDGRNFVQTMGSTSRDGVFVPLCTRNVFLKCYNPQVDHVMFWTQKDRDGYRQVMIDTLHGFFTSGWAHD
jgi:hypothetical protein